MSPSYRPDTVPKALPVPGVIPVIWILPRPIAGSIPVARPITTHPAAGRIRVGGRSPIPSRGRIHASRVLAAPRPGRIKLERLVGLPGRSGISVPRVRLELPRPGSLAVDVRADRTVGDTGLGKIGIADPVIARIAGRAVLDIPDAGGVAPSLIGKLARGHLGVRETSLDSIPKTSAKVDGTRAFVTTVISVRYPASIGATAQAVRDQIRQQVAHMAGIDVPEVEIQVEALINRAPSRPRVR